MGTIEDHLTAGGLLDGSILDADSVPNENQSLACMSCDAPITGLYCSACGQKNDDYRRSLTALGIELLASITAFESRIWRSLRSLITRPGQMAREFSDGSRQRWTSPVRMYLAMSLLLFGYVTLSKTQLVAFAPVQMESSVASLNIGGTNIRPKVFFLQRKSTIEAQRTDEDIKLFEEKILSAVSNNDDEDKPLEALQAERENVQTSIQSMTENMEKPQMRYARGGLKSTINALEVRLGDIDQELTRRANQPEATTPPAQSDSNENVSPMPNSETETLTEALAEVITEINDEIADAAEDLGSEDEDAVQGEDTVESQETENGGSTMTISGLGGDTLKLDSNDMRNAMTRALREPQSVNARVNRHLPQIMFLMMPFSMLLGAIFIRGREKAMLYDHLVHAAYIHAFSFLLLFVFILLVQFTAMPGLLAIYTLILLIYLPASAKRMFGRGWFKTFLTSYGVGLIYTFNMGIILFFLMVMGLYDIAAETVMAKAYN